MSTQEEKLQDLDKPEDALVFIGRVLLQTQQFENVLGSALKLVFSDRTELNAESFFKKDKRSLGRLLNDLRSIVSIDKDVDKWLTRLVEERNVFVHHLDNQEWFDLDTKEGRNRIWGFMQTYYTLLEQATLLFTAIIMEYLEDNGLETSLAECDDDFIDTIKNFLPETQKLRRKD